MQARKLIALILILGGAVALAYGGFTYTRDSHRAELGPLSIEIRERETVSVPVWAGLGAVLAGTVLLLVGGSRRR